MFCKSVDVTVGSYSTVTDEEAKFTLAFDTPMVLVKMDSTLDAQAAQVMPVTGNDCLIRSLYRVSGESVLADSIVSYVLFTKVVNCTG